MNEYIILSNNFYEIYIDKKYEDFGKDVMNYSTVKLKEYLNFFKEDKLLKKLKGSFFDNRKDFLTRIKYIAPNEGLPPEWATGCFYGGEAQILVDKDNLNKKFRTLAHETFHIIFQKNIYEKFDIDRIVWLDESLAANFSGEVDEELTNGIFIEYIKKYLNKENLPKMNDLDFKKGNIKTEEYNAYHFFHIVGRYLRENMSNEELFEFIKNKKLILENGNTILNDSLEYFKNKYKMVVNNEEINYKIKK